MYALLCFVLTMFLVSLVRSHKDLITCIPTEELQGLAKTKNILPRDRKVRNALKRIHLTYSTECTEEPGVPAASFQDVMRVLLAAKYLNVDADRSSEKTVRGVQCSTPITMMLYPMSLLLSCINGTSAFPPLCHQLGIKQFYGCRFVISVEANSPMDLAGSLNARYIF